MATGALDANGIWQYGEDDLLSPWSAYMNKGMASVSAKIATLGSAGSSGATAVSVQDTATIDLTLTGTQATGYTIKGDLVGGPQTLKADLTPGVISNAYTVVGSISVPAGKWRFDCWGNFDLDVGSMLPAGQFYYLEIWNATTGTRINSVGGNTIGTQAFFDIATLAATSTIQARTRTLGGPAYDGISGGVLAAMKVS
jgi:hypothetical protein